MASPPPDLTDAALRRTEAAPEGGGAPPEVGERIDRFTVREVLGRGGMGVVLAADDPNLDRRVALKLVHPGGQASEDRAESRARLLREARAMAALRHPNVLTVHEAGTHEGEVYVVMEQVEGGTLGEEIARRREQGELQWRDVLQLYCAAGAGLAAAHRAGLIHRDFKPDNVLVDRDGRVLVADFGLVGASAGGSSLDGSAGMDPLTRADAVLGTPAYMPPEQHCGRPADERTDQFAFCVSLWEALYGELPFEGATRPDYVEAVESGALRDPPKDARVPPWLRQVIARGLAPDPDHRYPSLEALLRELDVPSEEPGGRAMPLILAAAALVMVLLPLGVSLSRTFPPSSTAMLALDGAVFGLLLLSGLPLRRIWRTRFDLRIYGLFLLAAALPMVQTAAGTSAGFGPSDLLAGHLLLWSAITAAGSISLDPRVLPAALPYLIAYLLRVPPGPAIFAMAAGCNAFLLVNMAIVIRLRLRAQERSSGPRSSRPARSGGRST